MKHPLSRGVTLLETMLYIGIVGIVLPAFSMFVLNIWQQQIGFDARMRLEQTTSLFFLEMTHEITEADSILVSTSTLANDTGVFKFTDENGIAITVDLVTTTIAFSGVNTTVHRLRIQHTGSDPVWVTDPEQNVTQWRIEAVRNASSVLTGLRLSLDAELINKAGKVYRNATFAGDTTISLSPHTTEL